MMPLPQATDWLNYAWFPRIAYTGILPIFDDPSKPIGEVERGYAPSDILESTGQPQFDFRLMNGASLGLQLPYLKGDEECLLTNMHAKRQQFDFQLPGERPKIWTDGRKGTFKETEPVVYSVVIEADEARVSIVWCGAAPALRHLTDDAEDAVSRRVEFGPPDSTTRLKGCEPARATIVLHTRPVDLLSNGHHHHTNRCVLGRLIHDASSGSFWGLATGGVDVPPSPSRSVTSSIASQTSPSSNSLAVARAVRSSRSWLEEPEHADREQDTAVAGDAGVEQL